jgi:hypothetical protein
MQRMAVIAAMIAALGLSACASMRHDDDAMAGTAAHASATPAPTPPVGSMGPTKVNPTPANESLHDKVHDALMTQMGEAVNGVGVEVDGAVATLSGHVRSQADKDRAVAVAQGVAGVSRVDADALVVGAAQQP